MADVKDENEQTFVDSTTVDPVKFEAAELQSGEAVTPEQVPPGPSWESGRAPSLPSVDNEDNRNDDTDSAVDGLSTLSSATSLRSSIYEQVEENGRTYHRFRQGKYMLPNDKQEQERLDIQHALFRITLHGKLHLAPIGSNPQNVLDVATGTGIWAIDFAQQYPSAQVLGIDLSAIQPFFVPPNCRFEIDDAEDEWIFGEQFDYIHGRALLSCFKDPTYVMHEAYKSLAPNGYLEMQDMIFPFEFLGELPKESPLYKWFEIIAEGAEKLGRPWTNVKHYKRWMEEIGFEDVIERKFYWPINPWAKGKYFKQIAVYAQADFLNGLEGMSLKVMGSMGWTAEEVQNYLIGVRKDVKDTAIHCYCPMTVVYGRKPGGRS